MKSKENQIKTLIEKAAKGFSDEFEECRRLFATDEIRNKLIHSGEFGMYRERISADLIRKFLPQHMNLGEGFVINSRGETSTQVDIVVYDAETTPRLESAGCRFYPFETVYAVGEIKSKITREELPQVLNKLSENKKIRNCLPENPFPTRPAGLSEAIMHALYNTPFEELDRWGDFRDLIPVINDYREGLPNAELPLAIFNAALFEELNFVSFLICDEVEGFDKMSKYEYQQAFSQWPIEQNQYRFNLILSIKDGVIFHRQINEELQLDIPSPFPMHRNEKAQVVIRPARENDTSHIVIFISLLLHALTRTALYEISPLPYVFGDENIIDDSCIAILE